MKQIVGLVSLVVLLLAVSNSQAQCVKVEDGSQVQIVDLVAGQNEIVGSIYLSVDDVEENLMVIYSTEVEGWEITEVHLWVGDDLADMPQTKKGSPKIGRFPYTMSDLGGVSQCQISVPLSALEFVCPMDETLYYVAAHAVVQRVVDGVVVQGETAWGDGERMVKKGTWATYFDVTLTCECETPPPPPPGDCDDETVFAYAGPDDMPAGRALSDSTDSKRWGWEIGPIDPADGTFTLDLYAGAGGNDINNGIHVGLLTVTYNNDGTLSANFSFKADGYDLTPTEIHLNISSTPWEGAPPAAGQFTDKKEDIAEGEWSITITGDLPGDVDGDGNDDYYLIGHAAVIVCEE